MPNIFQLTNSSPALVSTSSDRMLSSQYLRVTLKSVLPINRFMLKAVEESDRDMDGETLYIPHSCHSHNHA